MATHQPNQPLRFAIVGTGWAGIRHLEAAERVGAWVAVTSICDTDQAQLQKVADRFRIRSATSDFDAILADDAVDVVDICTPHDSHVDLALRALAAGKHVLVEKPLSTSVADGKRMIEAARDAGLRLGVAEHQVYDEATRRLRRALHHSILGEVVSVIATWGFRAPDFTYPGRRSWLTDPQLGGTGTWMLHGIHRVAQLRALFGEVDRIYAVESRTSSFTRRQIEATVTALMTLESGVPVGLTQSSELSAPDALKGITVFGEQGVCTFRGNDLAIIDHRGALVHEERIMADPLYPYSCQLESFARHIVHGVDFPTNGEWELGSLAVVEAGYLSFRSNTSISVAGLLEQ